MNKSELIKVVAEKADITAKDAGQVVSAVFDSIAESLANGEKVQLIGFGAFDVKEREAREGRNPATGGTVQIPARKVPVFKAGKTLKARVRGA